MGGRRESSRFCALALVAAGLSGGCTLTRYPAAGGAPADGSISIRTMGDADWPAREQAALGRVDLNEELKGTVAPTGAPSQLPFCLRLAVEPCGRGWIWHEWLSVGKDRPLSRSTGFGYAAWRPGATPPVAPRSPGAQEQAAADFPKCILATADYHQRFDLTLPEQGEPVGLVLHAFSLSSGKAEAAVMRALRRRGWAVLTTAELSFSSGTVPKRELPPDAGTRNDEPFDPERFFEGFDHSLDQVLADYAYAAEAAVAHAQEWAPSLRGKPVVLVGFSLGAILGPTAAVRLGDQVAAVVLVGGGADFMGIAANSPVGWSLGTIGTLRARLGWARFDELDRERLEQARLDPYWTALALRHKPVLVVHAAWDSIVPSRYGELLWERLGRPERQGKRIIGERVVEGVRSDRC